MNYSIRKSALISSGIFALVMGLCLLCAVCGGLALMVLQERLYPSETMTQTIPDSVNEYHRGVYDACAFLYTTGTGASDDEAVRDCNKLVKMIDESGWYEQESKGYEAP